MGFKWDSRSLHQGLAEVSPKVDAFVAAVVEFQASQGEAAMKSGAPWTDRTGAARTGLHTRTSHQPMVRHEIRFSHNVFYGIWLEVRFNERFAIILRSVRQIGRSTMEQLRGGFRRIR